MADCALKSSVIISGINLNLRLIVVGTEKWLLFDVLLTDKFAKILMLAHPNGSQLTSEGICRISIINAVCMISSSMPENGNNLIELVLSDTKYQTQNQN